MGVEYQRNSKKEKMKVKFMEIKKNVVCERWENMEQKLWRQREEGMPRRLERATWETQSASRLEIHLNISGPAVDKKKKK